MRTEWEAIQIPDANEEYLFYETLVGTWPLEKMTPDEHGRYVQRIQDYLQKCAKEAKLHTSWISPNEAHDEAITQFVRGALAANPANVFLADFAAFRQPIAMAGILNSLSQTLIKVGIAWGPGFLSRHGIVGLQPGRSG